MLSIKIISLSSETVMSQIINIILIKVRNIHFLAGISVFIYFYLTKLRFVDTNLWSTFITQDLGFSSSSSLKTNLFVYKNELVACGEDSGQLSLAKLDLDGKKPLQTLI